MKRLRYRFSLLVAELKTTELVAYKTTLMAFINCILVSCDDDLQERCRIRNEFIGKCPPLLSPSPPPLLSSSEMSEGEVRVWGGRLSRFHWILVCMKRFLMYYVTVQR